MCDWIIFIGQLCITAGCSLVCSSPLLSWPSLLCSSGSGLAGLHFHIPRGRWPCVTELLEQCCISCCTVGWVLWSLGEVTAQSIGPLQRGILLKANVPYLSAWGEGCLWGFCICKLFGEVLVYQMVFLIKFCPEQLLAILCRIAEFCFVLDFCEYDHLGCIKT